MFVWYETILAPLVEEEVDQKCEHDHQEHGHFEVAGGGEKDGEEDQSTHPEHREDAMGDGHKVVHQVGSADVHKYHHQRRHVHVRRECVREGGKVKERRRVHMDIFLLFYW